MKNRQFRAEKKQKIGERTFIVSDSRELSEEEFTTGLETKKRRLKAFIGQLDPLNQAILELEEEIAECEKLLDQTQ